MFSSVSSLFAEAKACFVFSVVQPCCFFDRLVLALLVQLVSLSQSGRFACLLMFLAKSFLCLKDYFSLLF